MLDMEKLGTCARSSPLAIWCPSRPWRTPRRRTGPVSRASDQGTPWCCGARLSFVNEAKARATRCLDDHPRDVLTQQANLPDAPVRETDAKAGAYVVRDAHRPLLRRTMAKWITSARPNEAQRAGMAGNRDDCAQHTPHRRARQFAQSRRTR